MDCITTTFYNIKPKSKTMFHHNIVFSSISATNLAIKLKGILKTKISSNKPNP